MINTFSCKNINLDKNSSTMIKEFCEKLRNNFSSEKSFKDISIYLNLEFEINFLILTIYDDVKHQEKTIFENINENLDKALCINFEKTINNNTKINFSIFANNKYHFEQLSKCKNVLKTIFDLFTPIIFINYLQERIKNLKVEDYITGLYNRKYLHIYLDNMLPLTKREDKKIAFLMIGIDHFKAVIDEFDYNIGDKVLHSLAKLLSKVLRTSDIVVRLEAEEFLVALPNIHNEENAILVTQKIINEFAKCEVIVNEETRQTLKKTICVGITIYPDDCESEDELLKNTDISLYEARNKGRSSYFKYNKKDTATIELF